MRFRRSGTASSKDVDSELKNIVTLPENGNKCGECGTPVPQWCSLNLGILLCGKCAAAHRRVLNRGVGDAFSEVKSLTMDRWTYAEIEELSNSGGNRANRALWNPRNEPFPYDGDENKAAVERFVENKYIVGKFRYDSVASSDFNGKSGRSGRRRGTRTKSSSFGSHRSQNRYDDDDDDDDDDDYRYSSSSGQHRAGSRGPRSKQQKFSRELRELQNLGYFDENRNIDALYSSRGDIGGAIDYLERFAKLRESRDSSAPMQQPAKENTPSLPQRKPNRNVPQPAIFDGGVQQTTGMQQPSLFDGGVQQYLDPATGIIYVDQNQVAAHQQQQLMQAQMTSYSSNALNPMATGALNPMTTGNAFTQNSMNASTLPLMGSAITGNVPGVTQQPTGVFAQNGFNKDALMNMYQRPDMYTTPVELNPSHPQYQQIMQMQQMQQMQQQQQQYPQGPFM